MRINIKNLPNILYVLFLLILPVLGKTLNFLESFIVLFATLSFSFYYLNQKQTPRFSPKLIWVFSILLILYAISTLYSQNPGSSYYALFYFILTLQLINLSTCNFSLKNFYQLSIVVGTAFAFIYWSSRILVHYNIYQPSFDSFFSQIWGHSYLADFLLIPLTILIDKLRTQKSRRILFSVVFLFIFITLIFTNSRSALLALIVGLTVYIWRSKIYNRWIYSLLFFSVLLLAIINIQIAINPTNKYLFSSRPTYWTHSLKGFVKSPIIGLGPATFFLDNSQISPDRYEQTPYAHNSILQFLYENGIIFTLIIIALALYCLKYHIHQPLLFSLNIALLTHSMLDPSWSSLGILTLNLVLLLTSTPLLDKPIITPRSVIFNYLLTFLLTIFFISKTLSDFLFISQNYLLSLKTDPFNLNSQLQLISNPDIAQISYSLYPKDRTMIQSITSTYSPNDYEQAFIDCLKFEPQNYQCFSKLLIYYDQSDRHQDLLSLINQFPFFLKPNSNNRTFYISLYLSAIKHYSTESQFSLKLLELLNRSDPEEGHFYVELANLLWYMDRQNQAKEVLNSCIKLNSSPSPQCNDYFTSHRDSELDLPGNSGIIDYITNQYLQQNPY